MRFPRFRLVCPLLLLTLLSFQIVLAQGRRFEPRLGERCQLEAPLTRLEELDNRMQTVIVRGSTTIMNSLSLVNSTARVDAIELRDAGSGEKSSGVVVILRELSRDDTRPAMESRSYIDYEEIGRVIKAWDQVARTDDTVTKFDNFESRYRTSGDLEIAVFRQKPGGSIAALISGGICERVRIFLSLDELIKLRHMIAQAKDRLDEIK